MNDSTWVDPEEGWVLVRSAAMNSVATSHRHSSPNHDRSYRILSVTEDKIIVERIGRDGKAQQQPLSRKSVCDMIDVLNDNPHGCERSKLNGTFYKTNLLIDLLPRLRLDSTGRVTVVPNTSAPSTEIQSVYAQPAKTESRTKNGQEVHNRKKLQLTPKRLLDDDSPSKPIKAVRAVASPQKVSTWNSFCREHRVLADSVPLFETSGSDVRVTPYGRKNPVPVLTRSREMDALIKREAAKVVQDFHSGSDEIDGLIYMMLREADGCAEPLYIGKTEKHGRRSGNLSANLGTASISAKYCRWGYDYAYHVGDLSEVVCVDHDPKRRTPKYVRWADALFDTFPTTIPKLKFPVRFWIKAWKAKDIGILRDMGPTSLTFLEYQLIGVASEVSPKLLNREGVNRPGGMT